MDKDKENDLDLIIDYINGELSNEQKIKFEERLILENDLVESLRFQKEIRQAFVKIQTREQVISIHENAKLLDRVEQIKGSGISKNIESNPYFTSNDTENRTQYVKYILRKIAAIFIPIILIGSLWTWFNHNSGSTKPISNYVAPIEKDSSITPPSDKQNIEKNDSNQNLKEDSYLKRIDVVQLNPDVSFGFAQKKEASKNICSKRIFKSSNGFNSMYRLNADTLVLYLNTSSQSEEILFEIQHDDESQSTLENGFYLKLDNNFYVLNNNNKTNKLILLDNKSRVSELNKLTKRK
jgi:hypothetical protein